MTSRIDGTHDPSLRSWVDSANGGDFPVQNLPLAVFRRGGEGEPRIGCAIGDRILDLRSCAERGLLRGLPSEVEVATLALPSKSGGGGGCSINPGKHSEGASADAAMMMAPLVVLAVLKVMRRRKRK